MLNSGVLRFDANGRIRHTTSPPLNFNGGTPTNQGLLCTGNALLVSYNGGLGYDASQILCVDPAGPIVDFAQGGMPMNAGGFLCVAIADVIAGYNAGLPVTTTGRVVLATAEAPVLVSSFSSAFAPAFD